MPLAVSGSLIPSCAICMHTTAASIWAFPVFNAGRRMCLGKNMALAEMKTLLSTFIRRGLRFEERDALPLEQLERVPNSCRSNLPTLEHSQGACPVAAGAAGSF